MPQKAGKLVKMLPASARSEQHLQRQRTPPKHHTPAAPGLCHFCASPPPPPELWTGTPRWEEVTFGFPSGDPGGPRCVTGPDAEQEAEIGAMCFMGPHPHFGGMGDLAQGQAPGTGVTRWGSRGPKEGTRSHLSTPNATAPGREQTLGAQGNTGTLVQPVPFLLA